MSAPPPPPPPLRVGPLTVTDFVRYQGASGDMNPLHHDPLVARAAGFEGPIAVGMLHAGLLGSYAASWLGRDAVRRLHVRFRRPVLAGETLTCVGEVDGGDGDGAREEAGERVFDVTLRCTNAAGDVVAAGSATLALGALGGDGLRPS